MVKLIHSPVGRLYGGLAEVVGSRLGASLEIVLHVFRMRLAMVETCHRWWR